MSSTLRPYFSFYPKLAQRVFIDPTSTLIGDVSLADDVSIWPLVAIRGDINHVCVGARSNIQEGTVIHVTHKSDIQPAGFPTLIGDDVTVGHKAMLHGCTIGNRVLIGMGAIVLDGAVIDDEVLLAAGSLVPPGKHLKTGYLYLGNPARLIRPLTEEERQELLNSANRYVRWKDSYLAQQKAAYPQPSIS